MKKEFIKVKWDDLDDIMSIVQDDILKSKKYENKQDLLDISTKIRELCLEDLNSEIIIMKAPF